MSEKAKGSFFDKLPPTLIKKNNVTLFPEAAIGYLVGPTLALLANSALSNYFNRYMTDVLDINSWASAFFTWLPVVSVIFVVFGNILVGQLMNKIKSKNGKARPLLLLSLPISLLALLFLFVFSRYNANSDSWHPTRDWSPSPPETPRTGACSLPSPTPPCWRPWASAPCSCPSS